HSFEGGAHLTRDAFLRQNLLRAGIAPLEHDVAGSQIARSEFENDGNAAAFPMEEFRAGILALAVIDLRACIGGNAVRGFEYGGALFVLAENRNDDGLAGR